jgi:NADH:ubiquinone oxidoreductase subunit 2 (subunit N)
VYYVKVLKVMILDRPLDEVEGEPAQPLPKPIGASVYAAVMAAMILVLFVGWDWLLGASQQGAEGFRKFQPAPALVRAGEVAP